MVPPPRTLSFLVVALAFSVPGLRAADPQPAEWAVRVRPFLETHCIGCHDGKAKKGGLDLEKLPSDLAQPAVFRSWLKVHDRVRAGEMPPAKRKRPPQTRSTRCCATSRPSWPPQTSAARTG